MTHYSDAQRPAALFDKASEIVEKIFRQFFTEEQEYLPVLSYSGMSGISAVTAVSYLLQQKLEKVALPYAFGMAYVRKPNEESHGLPVEFDYVYGRHSLPLCTLPKSLIFVDDFIDSGHTRDYVFQHVEDYLTRLGGEVLGRFLATFRDTSHIPSGLVAWQVPTVSK